MGRLPAGGRHFEGAAAGPEAERRGQAEEPEHRQHASPPWGKGLSTSAGDSGRAEKKPSCLVFRVSCLVKASGVASAPRGSQLNTKHETRNTKHDSS